MARLINLAELFEPPSPDFEGFNEGLWRVPSEQTASDLNYDLIQNMIKAAQQLIRSEKFAAAGRMLQEILQKSEQYGKDFAQRDEILKMQALAYWRLGKWEDAGSVFHEEFNGRSELIESLVKESLSRGKRSEAEKLMNQEFDGRVTILEFYVESLIQDKKWTKAKQYLLELLRYESTESVRCQRMNSLAQVCFAKNELSESQSYCLEALQGNDMSSRNSQYLQYESVKLLAQISRAKGNLAEAQGYMKMLSESQTGLEGIQESQ